MMDLQTLVLNADYRPLSYNPLSLWSWKDAFTALFLDRVTLVASYDVEARSPSRALKVPSVVALKNYVTLARSPAFTRYNIYLRDGFACQYCGLRLPGPGRGSADRGWRRARRGGAAEASAPAPGRGPP
ncbi:HNH endonuclease, partial [Methylobacterium symbioticum]|uniref:HNH endonuclease n=1 Tax=Methylobacterium symbioticum TaxID=2584084 RepID=UPI001FCEB3B5